MKFSIVIPTFNNLEYLKLCIKSIRKNSLFDHDIIIHNNGDVEPDKSYLERNKCIYSIFFISITLSGARFSSDMISIFIG